MVFVPVETPYMSLCSAPVTLTPNRDPALAGSMSQGSLASDGNSYGRHLQIPNAALWPRTADSGCIGAGWEAALCTPLLGRLRRLVPCDLWCCSRRSSAADALVAVAASEECCGADLLLFAAERPSCSCAGLRPAGSISKSFNSAPIACMKGNVKTYKNSFFSQSVYDDWVIQLVMQ
jgi:hypothetical protein